MSEPAPDTQSGGRPRDGLTPFGERVTEAFDEWRALPENLDGSLVNARSCFLAGASWGALESSAALQEARDEAAQQFEAYQDLGHELRLEGDRLDAANATIAGLREQVEGLRAIAVTVAETDCQCDEAFTSRRMHETNEWHRDFEDTIWEARIALGLRPKPAWSFMDDDWLAPAPGDGALPPDARGEA